MKYSQLVVYLMSHVSEIYTVVYILDKMWEIKYKSIGDYGSKCWFLFEMYKY